MSKFSTPFFKKSPLQGAYENAADGRAFMGGLVSGQQQFAKLQQDITKGFESIIAGEDYSENQAERLENRIKRRKKRAQRISKRSGETEDYDYENDKVNKLLDNEALEARKQKALDKAEENKNKIFAENDEERAMIYALRRNKN